MKEKFQLLKEKLIEANNLSKAASVLAWDQFTQMPPGGAEARARQISTLEQLAQEKFTDPEIGRLLEDLQPYALSLPYESDEASLIRVTRREYEKMTRIPAQFVGKLSKHSARAYQLWAEARPENNFAKVQASLEKTLELSQEMANYFPGYEHIIDPLIDFSDYGMKASSSETAFQQAQERIGSDRPGDHVAAAGRRCLPAEVLSSRRTA